MGPGHHAPKPETEKRPLPALFLRSGVPHRSGPLRHRAQLAPERRHGLDRSISLERVAARVGISRKTLYEPFERELHQLPAEFVRQRRLSLARSLLAQTGAKPGEVARQCGMTLPTLLRQFQRECGMTPQAWRAATAQRQPALRVPEF